MQLILIKDGKKIMSTGRAVVKTAEEIIWYDSKNVLSIKFDVVVARRFCPCLAQDICQKLLPCFAA